MTNGSCIILPLLLLGSFYLPFGSPYAPAPDLNREEIAGIWRLTSRRSFLPPGITEIKYPMKEFTVFGKKKKPRRKTEEEEEMLVVIKEDGSFHVAREADDDVDDDGKNSDDNTATTTAATTPKNKKSGTTSLMGIGLMKGTWEFIDGKLILAADRPSDADSRHVHDTILIGNVFASSEKSLVDNPILNKSEQSASGSERSSSSTTDSGGVDVHLSVPDGSVEVGRFTYPKKHPYFFEQPIFQPTPTGTFQLRQLLGKLNTKVEKEEIIKFTKENFHNKRFLLTSQPIKYQPKGKLRWSKIEGRYVEDIPKPDPNEVLDIRVMEIEFFANNTFSTISSRDAVKILRGKFNVIGDKKDQLWFLVSRFGFGRSVSGSVFSEGPGLTRDDERAYWGQIKWVTTTVDDEDDAAAAADIEDKTTTTDEAGSNSGTTVEDEKKKALLEVKGSVLFGWGLEPEPVGKFTMKEIKYFTEREEYDDEDDDDDEDEDDTFGSDMQAFQ